MKIFTLFFLLFFFNAHSGTAQTSRANISFIFFLKNGAKTSAGVFDNNGQLIKTLWSGIYYDAGKHIASWDKKDDYYQDIAKGNYIIKVLSNNVSYKWE